MDRVEAYGTLVGELERWRQMPFGDLVRLVGTPPSVRLVHVGGEDIHVEVWVSWADVGQRALRIKAVANGPSCWRLERLEEAVSVRPPEAT